MTEFVVDPGNDGRIKIILPTGIDLDPDARVQETILVATIDRAKESGAAMIAVLPPLAADCRSEQQPAFYAGLAGQGTFPGKRMFVIIIKRKGRGLSMRFSHWTLKVCKTGSKPRREHGALTAADDFNFRVCETYPARLAVVGAVILIFAGLPAAARDPGEEAYMIRMLACKGPDAKMEVYLPQSAVFGHNGRIRTKNHSVIGYYALDLTQENKGKPLEPVRISFSPDKKTVIVNQYTRGLPPTRIPVAGGTVDFDHRFGTGAKCGRFGRRSH